LVEHSGLQPVIYKKGQGFQPIEGGTPFPPHLCSKKDDTLHYEKRYKIIVGSATDMKICLLYHYRDNNVASYVLCSTLIAELTVAKVPAVKSKF